MNVNNFSKTIPSNFSRFYQIVQGVNQLIRTHEIREKSFYLLTSVLSPGNFVTPWGKARAPERATV